MNNIFMAIDKQRIDGRVRNIYVKKNDKSKVPVKYIKYHGQYIVFYSKQDYNIITKKKEKDAVYHLVKKR
uniref:Uncharacterized protein n=1 Tax=viral metagenome TaxID=1070528 RepID=A0A6C0LMH3_9ZZZZ